MLRYDLTSEAPKEDDASLESLDVRIRDSSGLEEAGENTSFLSGTNSENNQHNGVPNANYDGERRTSSTQL